MKDEIWHHIIKRLTGQESHHSKRELDAWLAEGAEHQKKYEEVAILWEMTGKLQPQETFSVPVQENKQVKPLRKVKALWGYGIAAACVAALLVFGIYSINKKTTGESPAWVSVVAPKGKIISFTLPDSSVVVLNAGSQISYSREFNQQKNRLIKLSGEAFFDVQHQEKHPFVVESGKIKTVVYGTSFNIRAYHNEKEIKVSVKSGKVGVLKNAVEATEPVLLTRNQRLTFDTLSQDFQAVTPIRERADEWTNGTLTFEQTPVKEVFASLSRRFNVAFNLKALEVSNCKLTARFENQDLQSILKTIHTVMNIQIKQTNQTIYLKGGNTCNEN
ncbi:FecR family protein [Pedobacter sp. BMA]|uniref:FecR family protein n=1 Tax=Pedobacter sp. BMA TaxID=1663685 RepID=UPI00064A37D3|nr:FecR domain-containing protein [Pedobacter sp. BMA]KLT65666.1 hypothetical protein AB669_11425 [Pedobacter sp. BMA]